LLQNYFRGSGRTKRFKYKTVRNIEFDNCMWQRARPVRTRYRCHQWHDQHARGDVNAVHANSGWTLLHAASENESLTMIEGLAKAGAEYVIFKHF
jgi:hypothetical protein